MSSGYIFEATPREKYFFNPHKL